MRRALSLIRVLPLLLSLVILTTSAFGHFSFNLVIDEPGNAYFIDIFNNSLMKVSSDGEVSELLDLREYAPEERLHALAMDLKGNLYAGGYYQDTIWKVTPSGEVSAFYPFPGIKPPGREVLHVGFDGAGALYVMDYHYGPDPGAQKFRILKHAGPDREPSLLLEIEESDDAFPDFHNGSMLVTREGSVFLSGAHRIWRVSRNRQLELVAGGDEWGYVNGKGEEARFNTPYGMTRDDDGNVLVAELSGRIRRIDSDGAITTLAGAKERTYKDGPLEAARFEQAFALAFGPGGRLHVVEFAGRKSKPEYRIRVISNGRVTTLARIPSTADFRK